MAYTRIRDLYIGGRHHEAHAYRTAPHGTVKGVIRGIDADDTAAEIQAQVVNPANPLALAAHRIGSTTTVVVLFAGHRVPNYVKYGAMLLRCGLYKQHFDVCRKCGQVGHRMDVCPNPTVRVCFACGTPNPPADHANACQPWCKLCNGDHPTGAPTCSNKYKTPIVVTRRRWERHREQQQQRLQQYTAATADFPELPQTQLCLQPPEQPGAAGERRSRSRSQARRAAVDGTAPGARRSRSRRRGATGERSPSASGAAAGAPHRSQSRGGNRGALRSESQGPRRHGSSTTISWADAARQQTVSARSPAITAGGNPRDRSTPEQLGSAAELNQLRQENAQLRRQVAAQEAKLAAQDATILAINAKLERLLALHQQDHSIPLNSHSTNGPQVTANPTSPEMETENTVQTSTRPEAVRDPGNSRDIEPNPKRRALELSKERRIAARLDQQSDRQDRFDQNLSALHTRLGTLETNCQQLVHSVQNIQALLTQPQERLLPSHGATASSTHLQPQSHP